MFDINKLDVSVHAEQGIDVAIINPRDQTATGIVIRVLGVFAPRFKELLRQAKKRNEFAKRHPGKAADQNDDDEEIADMLAEVTLGWEGMAENGVLLQFSKAEASRVYQKYQLVRQQVFDAALDVSNFVKG